MLEVQSVLSQRPYAQGEDAQTSIATAKSVGAEVGASLFVGLELFCAVGDVVGDFVVKVGADVVGDFVVLVGENVGAEVVGERVANANSLLHDKALIMISMKA